jgi:hypothetical protein
MSKHADLGRFEFPSARTLLHLTWVAYPLQATVGESESKQRRSRHITPIQHLDREQPIDCAQSRSCDNYMTMTSDANS